jgi:DNA-binding response OmpR family regulator
MARIILIDDDDMLRTTVARGLTAVGHTVAVAANGFDGVALQRQEPADVILTDINMPHGGLPTIRVLRTEFPKLAIIAMSGNPTHLDLAGAIGATQVIHKPFLPAELAAVIAAVISAGTASPFAART